MGLYINPENMSKEAWLMANATEVTKPVWKPESGNLPVCWVSNGSFTAAGICFSYGEFKTFSEPTDPRPKIWYEAPVEKLNEVTKGALTAYLKNNRGS